LTFVITRRQIKWVSCVHLHGSYGKFKPTQFIILLHCILMSGRKAFFSRFPDCRKATLAAAAGNTEIFLPINWSVIFCKWIFAMGMVVINGAI
jgi:hypothetical protein